LQALHLFHGAKNSKANNCDQALPWKNEHSYVSKYELKREKRLICSQQTDFSGCIEIN
jgi:hypothetical protein